MIYAVRSAGGDVEDLRVIMESGLLAEGVLNRGGSKGRRIRTHWIGL